MIVEILNTFYLYLLFYKQLFTSSSLKLVKSINGEHYKCKTVFNNYEIRKRIKKELLQNLEIDYRKRPKSRKHLLAGSFLAFHNNL